MGRIGIVALLVMVSAACGTSQNPVVECNEIPNDICTVAIELATDRLDGPLPPLVRTEVAVGCTRSKPCNPHLLETRIAVAFYPSNRSEPIYYSIDQSEVGWPD